MNKLIASNFEIDLSNYEITTTEQNPWFVDTFNSKITYPFEIPLSDELDIQLGFVSRNTDFKTFYEVKYFEDDNIHDATFEIIEEQDSRLQVSYEYGLEQFPLWDKKLSELNLENFELGNQTMYAHAVANVNKVWPEKNYSFPAIHTPLYTDSDEIWAYFEGLINNYKFGEFLQNTFDPVEYVSYNTNIIQPIPALMHIFQTIANDAGYLLDGDILTDTELHDAFVYSSKEYFNERVPVEFYLGRAASSPSTSQDIQSTLTGYQVSTYELNITLPKKGRYAIAGTFRHTKYNIGGVLGNNSGKHSKVLLGGTILYENLNESNHLTVDFFSKREIDFEFDVTNQTSNVLTVYGEANFYLNPGENYNDYNTLDFNVNLVAEFDEITGLFVPSISFKNKIDLRMCVPDISVGDFITIFKNWFNYDYDIVGGQMIFNKIQDNMDFNQLISLEQFEVKSKSRKFQQGMSFLLKFTEREDSKYVYEDVFQDLNGISFQNFITNKKTNTIEINGLPLPNDIIRNFETANAFENSESKLYLVKYQGLINGQNKTVSPEPFMLPQIHATNYFKWLNFRINSVAFKITFKAFKNQVQGLNAKTKIFMYNKLHYIKTIMKTQTTPDIIEVEIESESLK